MRAVYPCLFALAALLVAASPAAAQSLVRVPADADLQRAINLVSDGGVIEIAAGTHSSPNNGWEISNRAKTFTLRAAPGAQVVLDGGAGRRILRFENGSRSRGRRVTFQDLTFRNGVASVSLSQAEAVFRDCAFESNAASPSSDYGAVRVHNNSDATFIGCGFRGNRSRNRGGAVSVEHSAATFQSCEFTGNRVNLAGHVAGSAGGAVYVLDSRVRVADSHFEDNEAGWVGGAIYAIGVWKDPVSTPRSDVLVTRSTFIGNRAEPVAPTGLTTTGGALHAEDQTVLAVYRSRFIENEALHGGAISNYRAVVGVDGSVFRGNRTPLDASDLGAGGAINVTSSDFADSSTGNGAINRRAGRLTVTDSFFQGRFGATGVAAHAGGCFFAGGDVSRTYGDGGVPLAGTLADNRAVVVIRNAAFFDCDVERQPGGGGGFGGAVQVDLTDLTLEDSIFLHSDAASGAAGGLSGGGALSLTRESDARVARTTFARNTAESRGGAVDLNGSVLQMSASRFLDNEVSPGVFEPTISQSLGAAIFTIPMTSSNPARARNVGGVVAATLFSDNVGLPIFDSDPQSGPINDVHYDGNEIYSTRFGDRVYVDTLSDPGRNGSTVFELNSLVVDRGSRGATDKSRVDNRALTSVPRAGDLVAVPSFLPVGASTSSGGGFVAYAWSGGSATLDGQPLPARSGVVEVAAAGTHTLAVDGVVVDTVTPGSAACTAGTTLCLQNGRFRAEVSLGNGGAGQAVALSGDTGYFWFFGPANVELVVKVLDGRVVNGRYWVYHGALSDVEYTLRIADTATGLVWTYHNPPGRLASGSDTSAFPDAVGAAGGALSAGDPGGEEAAAAAAPLARVTAATGTCVAGPTQLCLNDSRFRVEVVWETQGRSGSGQAVPITSDTGYFWFFDSANVELILKVLDGRPVNGNFWVFYGALSDVRYTITVTDTETGRTKTYTNPAGKLTSASDVNALPGS